MVPVYAPGGVVDGMSSSRPAFTLFVPIPVPACASARVAAVPRPGPVLPVFAPDGATAAPITAPPTADPTNAGVHPSELAGMVAAGVPGPVKTDSWPATDQPGVVFRVSEIVTVFSVPVAVSSGVVAGDAGVSVTDPVATVTLRAPVDGTVTLTVTGLVPPASVDPTDSANVPVEPLKLAGVVGVNTAARFTLPAVPNVVVVVAATDTLPVLTGAAALMLVQVVGVGQFSNWTVPAGNKVPDVTFAVKVTVPLSAAGFGDAVSVVVVFAGPAGGVPLAV